MSTSRHAAGRMAHCSRQKDYRSGLGGGHTFNSGRFLFHKVASAAPGAAGALAAVLTLPYHPLKPGWPAARNVKRSVEGQRGLAGRLSRSNLRSRGGQVGAHERGPPGLAAGSAHAPAACSPTGWDASRGTHCVPSCSCVRHRMAKRLRVWHFAAPRGCHIRGPESCPCGSEACEGSQIDFSAK